MNPKNMKKYPMHKYILPWIFKQVKVGHLLIRTSNATLCMSQVVLLKVADVLSVPNIGWLLSGHILDLYCV